MGHWWRRSYRYWGWVFFLTESTFSICWVDIGRIRPRSGCDCINFKQKRVKINHIGKFKR